GGGTITSTTRVTLIGDAANRAIILGSGTDAAAALELSDAELDTITSPVLQVGNAGSGSISFAGSITLAPANVPVLVLQTGNAIVGNPAVGNDVTVNQLEIGRASCRERV